MSDRSGLPPVPQTVRSSAASEAGSSQGVPHGTGWAPHDAPSAAELLDAVREFLESEVFPVVEGRVRFHVRVATNVVAMVARELVLGPGQAGEHAARLAGLGVADEAQLAEAIRSGSLDERRNEVIAAVRATVADKLAVANPAYVRPLEPGASSG